MTVVGLLVGVPKLPSSRSGPLFTALCRQIDARGSLLAILVRLVVKSRVRETFVIAACPLRPALLALDVCCVDEAIFLNPFRRAAVVLVITDVLYKYIK